MVRNIANRTANRPTPSVRSGAPYGAFGSPFMPLNSVIDDFFNDPFFALAPVALSARRADAPEAMALDVSEDDRDFIVRASLPGFTEEQITAEVNEGVLTIRAEKNEEETDNGERWHRRERRWGSVMRQVALPMPVKDEEAKAELVNGVLTLRLPKVEKAQPKRISIGRGTQEETRPNTNPNGQTQERGRMAAAR